MCEPTQQEDFATTVRQLTNDKFDLLLQFVIEEFIVCIKGEVGIVKPFFPINGCQVFNPVLPVSIDGEERLYYTDFTFDADNKLLYDELQEQIKLVIGQLPDRCREVFLLSRFTHLKNREIADKLQISTTAVEKHISKALALFERHFKDKYPVDIYIMVLAWVIMNE